MLMDPVMVLAGPRCRRMCLEFARNDFTTAADELREAIFYVAYDLDPGRGTSRVLFGPDTEQRPLPKPSLEDVVSLFKAAPLAKPDERALLLSLVAAVDNARYWQEPDGEDVLAASPELHQPLMHVAAQIMGSPDAAWWATSTDDAGQWIVNFDNPSEGDAALASTAGGLLERWRAALVKEETVAQRERPSDPSAMWGGSWWSTPPAALTQTTRSLVGRGPVGLWLIEDTFGWEAATTAEIVVPVDARTYEIDGPGTWVELCRRYPLDVTASRRHDWYRATGRSGRWVIPDWSQLRQDIDAVHLSVNGYLTAAGRALSVEDGVATVLAGWDPDKTYWLRDVQQSESNDQAWAYNQREENWELSTAR